MTCPNSQITLKKFPFHELIYNYDDTKHMMQSITSLYTFKLYLSM
jgi:hypothetical protein